MAMRRQIRSKDFLADVRAGMTPSELMEKYKLSKPAFRGLIKKIVEFQKSHKDLSGSCEDKRRYPRTAIDFPLWIYDSIDQIQDGRVLDLSVKGVRIEGLPASVGDERTFIVRFRAEQRNQPFVFDAVCRWAARNGHSGDKCVSGFEITHISGINAAILESLTTAC
jgi:hypothetical protein